MSSLLLRMADTLWLEERGHSCNLLFDCYFLYNKGRGGEQIGWWVSAVCVDGLMTQHCDNTGKSFHVIY